MTDAQRAAAILTAADESAKPILTVAENRKRMGLPPSQTWPMQVYEYDFKPLH